MSDLFYFARITNTETQTFDNSLEHFHAAGISGTIRENIQNSIDARLPGSEQPVNVKIELNEINKHELPGMEQIERHIASLVGGNHYTRETIQHMQGALLEDKINVLTFEDNNTKGLSGANQIGENTTFNIFAYKKGVHYEEDDSNVETTRGGSHGVGKIANNAASDIHLMYFANCDADGHRHLGGTIQLIEHKYDDISYRSTGYFTGIANNEYHPHLNSGYHPVFEKNTRGLKVIIPFLREDYSDIHEIVRAVCDNFFLAILESLLEVEVTVRGQVIMINHETIKMITANSDYYLQNLANIEEIRHNFTPLYIDTYLNKQPQKIEISSNNDDYSFNLYFVYNEAIKTGRVGIVRSMGMKIVDHKVAGYIRRPFNAVLIGGPKEDAFLKTLENESHTELSSNSLRDRRAKRNANSFLKNLNQVIGKFIDDEHEKLYPSEGLIDTADLLYEKSITFKTKLEELSEKIELANGKQIRKTKSKERRKSPQEKKGTKPMDPNSKKQRRPRKLKPTDEEEISTQTLLAPTEVVNRLVFTDREIIQFNLKEIKEVIPNGKVNIGFRVVDGEGREYDNEFDLKEAYREVLDAEDGIAYDFDSYAINNVKVLESVIKLILLRKDNRSSSLKFIYTLEVLA